MRTGPSGQSFPAIAQLPNSTDLVVVGEQNNPGSGHLWYQVRLYLEGAQREGFVDSDYIRRAGDCVDAGASNAVALSSSYYYVTGLNPRRYNWLALRNAPSPNAPWSPTQMPPDTLLTRLGEQGEWMNVRLLSGETGWANKQFIACCKTLNNARPQPPAETSRPSNAAPAGYYYYVDGLDQKGFNWLALRSAPNSNAPWSKTQMRPGTLLTVLSRSGDYYNVRLRSGETGWASARYVFCCKAAN